MFNFLMDWLESCSWSSDFFKILELIEQNVEFSIILDRQHYTATSNNTGCTKVKCQFWCYCYIIHTTSQHHHKLNIILSSAAEQKLKVA